MWLLCNKVLGNDAMKPSKLQVHLRRCHPNKTEKDLKYFQTLKDKFQKRPTLDRMFASTSQRNDDGLLASYNISLLIAKSGKPHTIGEKLILPAVEEVLKTVLHKPASDIIKRIPLTLSRAMHKKVLKSKRSGSSTEELYEPTLWYYKLLLFTASQEEPRMSVSNDDESESEGDDANNEEDVTQHDTQFSPLTEDALQAPSEIYQLSPPQTPHQSSTYSRPSTSRSSNSAKRKKYGQEESIQRICAKLDRENDEYLQHV
ncbi:unnamed protein product [Acanthoscelides obtectus]|uniref:Uncharacterized protein n=1 Tax=Acanthoscelides obtectus TaxID=200917 RepID=A0A9P0LXQ0_ACAOB|nr:unnamed protein product [Acanthoscelides obtectus]CAK1635990.1 Protein FAM200B [Acanthoscelides obtectus]